MNYSLEEKVFLASWAIVFNCERSVREFADKYEKVPPSARTVLYWKNKLMKTGSLAKDRARSGRPITASGDDNKQLVVVAVTNNPFTSTRAIAQEIGVSDWSVRKILKAEKYHPYKPVYNQFLCDGDEDRRLQFCQVMQVKFNRDPALLRKLSFSDECVFSLTGNVNKHSVHFWSVENPKYRIGNPGKTATLTVWACIGFSGILHYSISNQTMNSERYCEILRDKVVPYFNRGVGVNMFYQQDGASPHYSIAAREILNTSLADRWIGRRGPIEWPARSPDLTPCDYWFWSHLRQLVYPLGFKYNNVQDLERSIRDCMGLIPLKTFRDSFRNFFKRIDICANKGGELFED